MSKGKMVSINFKTGQVSEPDLTDPHNAAEAAIYEAQEKVIKKKYGEEAAEMANYGWGVDEQEDSVGVATKVYVDPVMILSSDKKLKGKRITHTWTKYK